MAVPSEMTTLNMSGKYFQVSSHDRSSSHACIDAHLQNKVLSDDPDEILRLQGVSWYIRTIISYATIYQTLIHRTEDGVEKITVEQVLSGGAGASTEERDLDWVEREEDNKLYGSIVAKARRVQLKDVEIEYLRNGFIDDGNGVIESYGASDTPKSGRVWVGQTVSNDPSCLFLS